MDGIVSRISPAIPAINNLLCFGELVDNWLFIGGEGWPNSKQNPQETKWSSKQLNHPNREMKNGENSIEIFRNSAQKEK
jgi:hypothetical protein